MLVRSLVAVFLSIPATVAVIGLVLALTPAQSSLSMSLLLLAFPLWVCVACATYLTTSARRAALVLIVVSIIGLGLVTLLRYAGLAGL